MVEVDAAEQRARAQRVFHNRVGDVAVSRGEYSADRCVPVVEVATKAADGIIGKRLDGRRTAHARCRHITCGLFSGYTIHQADCPPMCPASKLERAEYRRFVRRVDVRRIGTADRQLRCATDPAGVVEDLRIVACIYLCLTKLKDVRSGEEERPLLGEERLERSEIYDSGIYLHLAEIGIHRRGEREPVRQPVVEITTD